MYAHQFLNSFFMFPGMKAHAAWLIYESHNIPQSLLPPAPAVSLGLSHWKSQALSRSRAAMQQPGDVFKRLLQGLFSQAACPPHSPPYQRVHLSSPCPFGLLSLCAPGMLTPTFDQPCQPSPPHHIAPTPLICSPHSCNTHRPLPLF